MPREYEALRDRFIGAGMKRKAAEKKAARIYNSKRKPGSPPVGRNRA